jgi:hypothetical protein
MADPKRSSIGVVVGFAAGLLLAIAGTVTTWALTRHDVAAAETKLAVGASRLLADDLRRAEGALRSSLLDCRYRLYDVTITLPQSDQLLLASRLEAGEWEKVSQGTSSYTLQVSRMKQEHDFVQDDVTQIRAVIGLVDEARQTLENLSGSAPPSRADVESEVALGENC